MDVVGLKGIQVAAPVGYYAEEKEIPNVFEVSVWMYWDFRQNPINDKLENTVDYQEVKTKTIQAFKTGIALIETVAEDLAAELLHSFPTIQKVAIRIDKLNPITKVEASFVHIERSRQL